MSFTNKQYDQQDTPENKNVCRFSGCQGVPVFNGMCAFHASARDEYQKGAISIVLKNNPIYHKLLNVARKCGHFDPPKLPEEWKTVYHCSKLLDNARLLPEGFDLNNKELFMSCMKHEKQIMANGTQFGASWIGRELENLIVSRVQMEADRVFNSMKNKESLLSLTASVEEKKKFFFNEKDFQEFAELDLFKGY